MKESSTQVIRFPALSKKLGGVSRSTIFRWVRDKQFPRPIFLGKNSRGWDQTLVESWLASRAEEVSHEKN